MNLIEESDYLLLWLVAAVLAASLLLHKAYVDVPLFHLTHNTVNLSMSGAGHSLQPLQHLVSVVPGPGCACAPVSPPLGDHAHASGRQEDTVIHPQSRATHAQPLVSEFI